MKLNPITLIVIGLSFFISACTSINQPIGDPEIGKNIFFSDQIGDAPGCKTCHSIIPGETIIGPSLSGIALIAPKRVEGLSSENYLRQSILEPNNYLVEGFSEGSMYQNFSEELSGVQVNNLIAFLLTLHE